MEKQGKRAVNKKAQLRAEFFTSLVEQVKTLPVLVVIGSLLTVVDRYRRPLSDADLKAASYGNFLALCPFHPDEHYGSFVITPQKNMWWCFTEGIGWNVIDFERRYYDLDFQDAVFHLARRFDLISVEDYNAYAGKKVDAEVVKAIEKTLEKPAADVPQKRADDAVIHAVYSCMPEACGLKKAHKEQLLETRKLKEDQLGDYFTFPTRKMDLVQKVYRCIGEKVSQRLFQKQLRDLNEEERKKIESFPLLIRVKEQFASVPGFYMNTQTGRVDFVSYKGIGILVRDCKGHVVGVQIRRDSVSEGESRYVWFSSAFAQSKPGCEAGASSLSPGGVIFPKGDASKAALCITEGRFKAEKVADKGNIAIYVSGVGTWKKIIPYVRALKGNRKKVYVMFDADLMGNVAVHSQLMALCEGLRHEQCLPVLLLWSKNRGKGFDDLVINVGQRYSRYLVAIRDTAFEEKYEKVFKEVCEKHGVKTPKLLKDPAAFNLDMQHGVEEAVGVPQI